ncbi:hypothetical protein QUF90_18350 [Desulfococcaceae bacterium HSG9]|nr:hypothetical protein [Desulfococcaceae bacterium HSG9]
MKKTAFVVFMSLMFVSGISNPLLSADYAAMIMNMQNGTATYGNGPLEDMPVEIGGFLNDSDEIKIPDGASLVLTYFATSKREEIKGPARIVITPTQSKALGADSGQIKQEEIAYIPPKSNIKDIHARTFGNIAFRGVSSSQKPKSALSVLNLLNTTVITGTPVVLRWRKMPAAKKYVAKLFDGNNKLLQKTPTKKNNITFKHKELKPGAAYHWTLEAMKGEKPLDKAIGKFNFLSTAETNTLKTVRKNIQKRFKKNSVEGLLSLNLLYQGHGLHDNAVTVLLKLHKMHPQNSVVINQLNNLNPAILDN